MAHWDQRDPRWLVSELGANGSNVNNWHWEEKNKLPWSKQRLHELFNGIEAELDPSTGTAKITGVDDLAGEAYLTRRKGNKVLVVYDLAITLNWQGCLASESEGMSGQVKVTEFCLGSDKDDYEIAVTADKSDEKYNCLTEAVKGLQPRLLDILAKFDQELRDLDQ